MSDYTIYYTCMHIEWYILTQIKIKTILTIYNDILCLKTLESSKKKKKTWNGKKDGQNLIKSHGGGIPHSDHWSNMYIKSDQNHILE